MKLNIPKRQPAVKKKFEYYLPGDDVRVSVDAITLGTLCCLQDFAGKPTLAREAVVERARVGCENLKEVNKSAEELTNRWEYFLGLFTRHFVEAYLDQQARYQRDRELYQRDKVEFERIGWARAFVLKQEALSLAALQLQALMIECGFGQFTKELVI